MKNKTRSFVCAATVICFAVTVLVGMSMFGSVPMALAAAAPAKNFPATGKNITLVIGYTAGGPTDMGARIAVGALEKVMAGAKFDIIYKPGATGQAGATFVAKSKPDGYTMGVTNVPAVNVSYLDPDRQAVYGRKSFQPLANMVVDPGLIAVRMDSPFKSIADIIKAAKANPHKITITTTGLQSTEHFWSLRLQNLTNTQFALVHFEGTVPAVMAVLGGKVDVLFGNVSDVSSHVKNGTVRVLGLLDDRESPFLPPGVKTLQAQGIPLVGGSFRGFSLPGGTPKEIVNILGDAMRKALNSDEVKEKLSKIGLTWRYMDTPQFEKFWDEMDETMVKLIPITKQ